MYVQGWIFFSISTFLSEFCVRAFVAEVAVSCKSYAFSSGWAFDKKIGAFYSHVLWSRNLHGILRSCRRDSRDSGPEELTWPRQRGRRPSSKGLKSGLPRNFTSWLGSSGCLAWQPPMVSPCNFWFIHPELVNNGPKTSRLRWYLSSKKVFLARLLFRFCWMAKHSCTNLLPKLLLLLVVSKCCLVGLHILLSSTHRNMFGPWGLPSSEMIICFLCVCVLAFLMSWPCSG